MGKVNFISKIWQKKLHKKLYRDIRPLLVASQCLCAAPFHLSQNDFYQHPTNRQRHLINLFIHYVWSTIILSSIIVAIYFQYNQFDTNNIKFMARILYFGEYISTITSSLLIVIGCRYQYDKYIDYFNQCVDFLIRFEHLGVSTDSFRINEFIKTFHIGYAVFFSFVIITDLLYNNLNFTEFTRSSTVFSLPNIISVFSLLQYFFLLHFLAYCFKQINKLIEINERKQLNNFIHALSFHHKQQITINGKNYIEILRILFINLNEFYADINNSFGLLLICTFFATFVILSIQFYTLYTFADHLVPMNEWLLLYTILWIILHGGKTCFILLFNHFILFEVKQRKKITKVLCLAIINFIDWKMLFVETSNR